MVNIKTLPDRIIFDGHADTAKECETITLMCDGLAANENFRTVAYRKGYAEFEKIGTARELKFVGAPALLTMVFDNRITKVTGLGKEWTTSGTAIRAALPNSYDGVEFTFSVTLQDGYVLDAVSANLDYGSFGNKTDNSFTLIADSSGLNGTITITSKQSTPKVNIDLTTLSGYESLPAGTYAIGVKVKAANYQDSDLSATAEFTKLAAPVIAASGTTITWNAVPNAESYDVYVDGELYENVTGGVTVVYSNVTLEKVNVGGQIQGGSYISVGYSKISNADTTKYYLLRYNNSTVTGAFLTSYLYWDSVSSKWKASNSQTYGSISIVDSKSSSTEIVFCRVDNSIGAFYGWTDCQCLMTDVQPESATIADDVFTNNNATTQSIAYYICIIEGTQITLADRTTKPIEDITYDDDILVWNFYEGKFDSAKPCWIIKPQVATEYNLCKFSNGAEVGFVGQGGDIGYHRIYNDEAKAFTHTGVTETPVGTHTFAEDESFPELVSQEVIKKLVRFYNVGTTKHTNLFANGILTSSRISNKYMIEDMKYVGDQLISDSEERAYIDEKLTHG